MQENRPDAAIAKLNRLCDRCIACGTEIEWESSGYTLVNLGRSNVSVAMHIECFEEICEAEDWVRKVMEEAVA